MSPDSEAPSRHPFAEELETARDLVRGPNTWRRADRSTRSAPALTKIVVETALDEEMSAHLGYDKHETVGRNMARQEGQSPPWFVPSARRQCRPDAHRVTDTADKVGSGPFAETTPTKETQTYALKPVRLS